MESTDVRQRIKIPKDSDGEKYDEYIQNLTALHSLMVYSMKCKQGTDIEDVTNLRDHLTKFRNAYMGKSK